jgi:hypothetical protein
VELSGDLQQAIIPPALFAGGQFRFVARIDDKGKPVIELGFGTAASGRDDRLGVALAPFEGVAPALEDNRLVWPMTAMALTMLPQVLWEPVQSIDTPLTSP